MGIDKKLKKKGKRMPEKLFVYGTLRRKDPKPSNFIAMAKMSGKLYHLGGFPGAKESDNPEDLIVGEIYNISPSQLANFDRYEGYDEENPENSFYVREKVTVKMDDGSEDEVWVYMFNESVNGKKQITSGDWFNQ